MAHEPSMKVVGGMHLEQVSELQQEFEQQQAQILALELQLTTRERAVHVRFEQLEGEKLKLWERIREERARTQAANEALGKLVARSHEFVAEIRRLHDGVGPLQFVNDITQVQAAIDRYHDYLGEYQ